MIDFIPWLIAAAGVLLGVFGLFRRRKPDVPTVKPLPEPEHTAEEYATEFDAITADAVDAAAEAHNVDPHKTAALVELADATRED